MHRLDKYDIANKYTHVYSTLQLQCVVCHDLIEIGGEYVRFTCKNLLLTAHPQCINVPKCSTLEYAQ